MYGHQRCTSKDANLIVVLIHVGHIGNSYNMTEPLDLLKCDNMNDFVRMFKHICEEEGINKETVYIVSTKYLYVTVNILLFVIYSFSWILLLISNYEIVYISVAFQFPWFVKKMYFFGEYVNL
jgi:hypothetical protein